MNVQNFKIKEKYINDLPLYNNTQFDIKSSILEAKQVLKQQNKINFLVKCNFEENEWKLFYELQGYRHTLNFNEIKEILRFNTTLNVDEFIIIIKCWICTLINSVSLPNVLTNLRGLKKFFIITDSLKNFNLDEIIDKLEGSTDFQKVSIINSSINFFDYYDELENHEQIIYILYELKELYSDKDNTRILPPSRDILIFSKIVQHYFDSNLTEKEYLRWFPIWLWWNLTTNIPMRPSEFCGIKRNCLKEVGEKYYIKIPRLKQESSEKNLIQILNEISIPKNLYLKIKEYIEKTEIYGNTNTLISYESIAHYDKKGEELTGSNHPNKLVRDKYSYQPFYNLLESFYQKIVFKKYNICLVKDDTKKICGENYITKKIKPGDTRHLAFINLKRQGYHPVEIARIGGHVKLTSQEHYFNHIDKLVDLEILELITYTDLDSHNYKFAKNHSVNYEIIDKSFVDKFILNPPKTDFKRKMLDGYCTDPLQNCGDRDCWECDAWRISYEEFIEKKQKLEEKIVKSRSTLNEVINNLSKLYKSIYLNIGVDEYYIAENPEVRKTLINQSRLIDRAVKKYINLLKVKERIVSIEKKR